MRYEYIKAFDIPDAWYKALERIWTRGDSFYVGYGSEITETKQLNLTLEIENPHIRPLIADKTPCDMKYVTSYALQYLWLGEKAEGETYTYGGDSGSPSTRWSWLSRCSWMSRGTGRWSCSSGDPKTCRKSSRE